MKSSKLFEAFNETVKRLNITTKTSSNKLKNEDKVSTDININNTNNNNINEDKELSKGQLKKLKKKFKIKNNSEVQDAKMISETSILNKANDIIDKVMSTNESHILSKTNTFSTDISNTENSSIYKLLSLSKTNSNTMNTNINSNFNMNINSNINSNNNCSNEIDSIIPDFNNILKINSSLEKFDEKKISNFSYSVQLFSLTTKIVSTIIIKSWEKISDNGKYTNMSTSDTLKIMKYKRFFIRNMIQVFNSYWESKETIIDKTKIEKIHKLGNFLHEYCCLKTIYELAIDVLGIVLNNMDISFLLNKESLEKNVNTIIDIILSEKYNDIFQRDNTICACGLNKEENDIFTENIKSTDYDGYYFFKKTDFSSSIDSLKRFNDYKNKALKDQDYIDGKKNKTKEPEYYIKQRNEAFIFLSSNN